MERQAGATELILTEGQQAFLRDNNDGSISVLVGPYTAQLSGRQETPVLYDQEIRQYDEVTLTQCVRPTILAQRNEYILLSNPSSVDNRQHPPAGAKTAQLPLKFGEVEVIPGPASFALLPGQSAQVIPGHRLRSNSYLLIEVVDEEAARENWGKAILKATGTTEPEVRKELVTGEDGEVEPDAEVVEVEQPESIVLSEGVPEDLAVGQQYLVKGTDVRFYIPPTGVRVVPDDDGNYVRQALTLEIKEYAILVEESGEKEFPKGPAVVFPLPTQRFLTDEDGHRVFRPFELNELQGIHFKSLKNHIYLEEERGEGDEFFLTGKDVRMYYPHPLHAIVKYDGRARHFAVCVPEGETRYVLNRSTGVVRLVEGPTMLLPNPIDEVIVNRILSDGECKLWYPDNEEALKYNHTLKSLSGGTPTTRTGISDGQLTRSKKGGKRHLLSHDYRDTNQMRGGMESSAVSYAQTGLTEEIERSSTFTAPRSLTLDTKYAGAPVIQPWPGYAVLVVGKSGKRKVVKGPDRVHMQYDETLQPFIVSTGRPKSARKLHHDVYLRVANNSVRDEIEVVTRDHVRVKVYVSYRVGFTGETQDEMLKWWNVENYVKFLCEHGRSRLKAAVRRLPLGEFYAEPTDVVHDVLLGYHEEADPETGKTGGRPGMRFEENNLEVFYIDVLEVRIADEEISEHMDETMREAVMAELNLSQSHVSMASLREQTELDIERVKLNTMLEKEQHGADLTKENQRLGLEKARHAVSASSADFQRDQQRANDALRVELAESLLETREAEEAQSLEARKANVAVDKDLLNANTEATVTRYKAAQGPLTEALVALGDRRTMVDLAEATSLQRFVGGKSLSDALHNMLGAELAETLKALGGRAFERLNEIRGSVHASRDDGRPTPQAK